VKVEVKLVNENLAHARGGEVVLYKRPDSQRWQARFKLKDMQWRRTATKHINLQYAAQSACEAYDRARFLFDENIPIASKRFDAAANLAVEELTKQLAAKVGKSVYKDYVTVINKYLIPFFGRYNINSIGYEEMQAFGAWRERQLGRKPAASTVTTHISAMNRVFDVALERGWVVRAQIPKVKNTGSKGTAREAFSQSEYNSLIVPYISVTSIYLFGGDTLPELKVDVVDSGKTLNVEGAFGNGSYKKIKNILSQNKEVNRLYLDSLGGRLKEVTLIAKLTKEYKLDTYVEGKCLSFCTVIFLAGDKRYATPSAKLGFHSPALIENKELDVKNILKDDSIILYQSFNLPKEFIDKIFATDNSDMWYPPFQYLIDIGVVNQITLGGDSNVAGLKFGTTKESIIKYMDSVEFFRKVNSKFPHFYEEVSDSILPLLKQGKTDSEVFTAMRQKAQPLMIKAVSNSNQKIRLQFVMLGLEESQAIAKFGGETCYKFLTSQVDVTKVFPDEIVKKELKIYDEALNAKLEIPLNYSEKAAESIFTEIFTQIDSKEVSALMKPSIENGNLNCSSSISLYKAINSLSPSKQDIVIYEMFK